MLDMKRVQELLCVSRDVIVDCAQKNGAIIAANPKHPAYPKDAKNYRYVWPRDASFACVALDLLDDSCGKGESSQVQERFFRWCERAEGFKRYGLFFEKYYVNGKKALHNFQPDQTGAVLFAVHHHVRARRLSVDEFRALVLRAADGLCRVWSKDHFVRVSNDLWEERFCFPDYRENFTYSLASCIAGLKCAHEMIPTDRWMRTASEMESVLKGYFQGQSRLCRSFGDINDERIDASLLGVVYPFGVYGAEDKVVKDTVREIVDCLCVDEGIMRYEGDEYDGWMYGGHMHRKKGAGTWPLLSFWLSVYYSRVGDVCVAEKWICSVLDRVDGSYFPEQLFGNSFQKSVTPLSWSHCMFMIAVCELMKAKNLKF